MFGLRKRTPPAQAPVAQRLGSPDVSYPEPLIVVNRVLLTKAQAATVRMVLAAATFHEDDAAHKQRVQEVAALMRRRP